VGKYPDPVVAFPAHWAPLQMAIATGEQFPAKYRNGAFIAFHGSWNRAPKPQKGYNVTFVAVDDKGQPKGDYEVFADGFAGVAEFTRPADARYRPSGVAFGPDGSLYVVDSEKGRVWRIVYVGEPGKAAVAAPAPKLATAPVTISVDAVKGYQRTCGVCHMPDGSGVPNLQPPLVGSAVVAGDPARLVRMILKGPASVLPKDRPPYPAQMPAFASLSDQEIAGVLTYVRRQFGKGAGPISPVQVAAQRKK
jgi:mono/diheme cytochrome c family protein